MLKHLCVIALFAGIAANVDGQISSPGTKVIANRGNSNPALNGFCYFYGTAADIVNGGTQPPAITGLDVETFDVDFNAASSLGFPTVILTENHSNRLIVCRADNGAQQHVILNANSGFTEPDPVGLAVSEDGVLFVTNKSRTVSYLASDSASATRMPLITGVPMSNIGGDASGIHCTGNVAAGTCRLFLAVDDVVQVYAISGSLPGTLDKDLITTFQMVDGIAEIDKIPALSGTRDTIHIIENRSGVRDAMVIGNGADGTPGTADDVYNDAQALADNQVGQVLYPTGLGVLDAPNVNVGMPGAGPGVFALFEGEGQLDGITIGTLGTADTAGTTVPVVNGETNDAGIAVDEDADNDGAWDGGITTGGLNGGKNTGSVSVARFQGEINVWFISAGPNGGFGRLVLPQSTVPVGLSEFVLD